MQTYFAQFLFNPFSYYKIHLFCCVLFRSVSESKIFFLRFVPIRSIPFHSDSQKKYYIELFYLSALCYIFIFSLRF